MRIADWLNGKDSASALRAQGSGDSEQLVGVTSSVMLILLDSIFDHNMMFKHINYH